MKRIDDEKVRFYLKNQCLIDEWAAISGSVPAEVDRFMRSCSRGIEDLAADLGASYWSSMKDPEDVAPEIGPFKVLTPRKT